MSWISENQMNWIQKMGANLLKLGPVPRHVGIIMDGNRRYARNKGESVAKGHRDGFERLKDCLRWLNDLAVEEVTVYAFSIENFKREKQEVDNIMNLLRNNLKDFLSNREDIKKKGLGIRAIGNISLLPADVKSLFAEAEEASKENAKMLLNVAMAYTAREEMTNAVNIILSQLKNEKISEKDLNASLLNDCLYTVDSLPVDLILRTSGEKRLSDFLLFQGSFSYLHFQQTLWPQFSPWNLFWVIFKYQRVSKMLKESINTSIL